VDRARLRMTRWRALVWWSLRRVREGITPFLPRRLLDALTRFGLRQQRRLFARLDVQEAFERVYAENAWGGALGEFDSGDGSLDATTESYVAMVQAFIAEHGVRSVVDLGCGDFRVGRRLAGAVPRFVGVDVVPALIERNRRAFPEVEFRCSNLISDELPDAELGLLRQVLQHLSNQQIEKVLENCRRYRYLIVTEHLPVASDVVPNRDKPHGPDTRVIDRSGVFLDAPPYTLPVRTLLEVPLSPGEALRSVLVSRPDRDPAHST